MKETINSIYETLKCNYDPANVESFKLLVDAEEPVWDYKILNGELRLIHDGSPFKGVIPEVEKVTLGEILEECSEGIDLPIVSESTGLPFVEVQLVEVTSISKEKHLMLNFRTGTVS